MRHEFCTNGYENQKWSINRMTIRIRQEPKMAEATWTVKEGRRGRAGRAEGTLKSGPTIKRANYPPSHKCTPSNIFFLRSLREHSKRTRALAYASCISRRRARIMPRKSPRMHIIYTDRDHASSRLARPEGNAGKGRRKGKRGDKGKLIKLRVPHDVAFTRPNLPRKHICSGKVPADPRAPRASALFVAARIF